jgi:YVTN family beta-propeller protein
VSIRLALAVSQDSVITQIDTATNTVVRTINAGDGPELIFLPVLTLGELA